MYDFLITSVFKRPVCVLWQNCLLMRKGRQVNGKIALL